MNAVARELLAAIKEDDSATLHDIAIGISPKPAWIHHDLMERAAKEIERLSKIEQVA